MDYRSHTEEAIAAALLRGEEVWALDTAGRGEDDHLIGTYSQVLADVLHHHEMDELPADWSLDIVRPHQITPKIHYAHEHPWATVAAPGGEKAVIVSLTSLLYDEEGRLYLLVLEDGAEHRLYLD